MNIFVSGISFKTAPAGIRERLSFDPAEQKTAMERILKLPGIRECVLLSTCNRSEAYVCHDDGAAEVSTVEDILCRVKGFTLYSMKKHFYTFEGTKAVRHLFKVACGLDSMVLGEDQILGQVKTAYQNAMDAGACAGFLNTLFRDAITGAKKVKTETELSKNSLSIGSLAVKHAAEMLGGDLGRSAAMVIGTGAIGSIVLKNLQSAGIGRLYITNRSHGKLESLQGEYPEADLVPYESRYSVMDRCNVIVSATACPHYTVTKDMLEASLAGGRERVFIDLAMPRDMDEAITEIPGVIYVDLDGLRRELDENIGKRSIEAVKAEKMIDRFVMEYEKWYEFRTALPVVRELQKYADELVADTVEATLGKLKNVGGEDRETVKTAIAGTVNIMMNKFLYGVRESGSTEEIRTYFKCIRDILTESTQTCRKLQ